MTHILKLSTVAAIMALCVGLVIASEVYRGSTVPYPAPSNIKWTEHQVGGMCLVNPLSIDSLGNYTKAILPPGSVLFVPSEPPAPKDSTQLRVFI